MACLIDNDHLVSAKDALGTLLSIIEPVSESVRMELKYADDRILSEDIIAPRDFPHYDLCIKDGYAVRSTDMIGCGPASPVYLRIVTGNHVGSGECLQVHSGSALPDGADSIAPVEIVEVQNGKIVMKGAVKPGEFIKPHGSVICEGALVYGQGKRIKPTDIAMLLSLGLTGVSVYKKPRVLIIPTGDEIINVGIRPGPGFVNECNGLMSSMLVERFGGLATLHDIVPDNPEALIKALRSGLEYDLIITSGGTSVGARDHIHEVVSSIGEVLVHGIAFKPGRPSGIGYIRGINKNVAIMFLPGFPEACAACLMAFIEPAICKLGHYLPPVRAAETVILEKDLEESPGTTSLLKVSVDGGRAYSMGIIGRSDKGGRNGYAIITGGKTHYKAGDSIEISYIE